MPAIFTKEHKRAKGSTRVGESLIIAEEEVVAVHMKFVFLFKLCVCGSQVKVPFDLIWI